MSKLHGIAGFALVATVTIFFVDPIPQDPSYHSFADQRSILGIPNFWNVVSNLPFLLVGMGGLFLLARRVPPGALPGLRVGYIVFFAGITLIAIGSGCYHVNPTNASLAWDRLPMTVSFMAFFAVIVGENVSERTGKRLLWPLVVVGLLSVAYWYLTELQGRGDLRPYVLVQFLPMALIPVILWLYEPPFASNRWVWLLIGAYAGSKLAELADFTLFEWVGFGGHAIKHVLAALGALFFLLGLQRRVRLPSAFSD